MLTVAVIAQKGGVGKTTLALHLAVEAAKGGRVVIIDTDPQASAAQWADERQAPQPAVVTCPASRLPVSLHAARQSGAHVAFIDTAPAVESPALAAVRAADFCLIVSRPGILDLRSIGINVQIAKLAGKPVALVINAAPASGARASRRARTPARGTASRSARSSFTSVPSSVTHSPEAGARRRSSLRGRPRPKLPPFGTGSRSARA
jgi:chromosome partitioning protein